MTKLPTTTQAIKTLEEEMQRPRGQNDTSRLAYTTQALQMAADALEEVGQRLQAHPKSRAILAYLGDNDGAVLVFNGQLREAFADGMAALRRINR